MSIQALTNGITQAAKQTVAPVAKEVTKKGFESARDKALTRFSNDLARGPTLRKPEGKKADSTMDKAGHAVAAVAKWAIPIVASAVVTVAVTAALTKLAPAAAGAAAAFV